MARGLVRLVAAVLLVVPAAASADHPGEGVDTLAGIGAVTVVVDSLGARLQDKGVEAGAIRRAVRSVLEKARLATGAAERGARLHVRLDSRRASHRFLALAIDIELRQHVRLDRDPDRVISATTWSNAAVTPLGLGSTDAVPERVARFVERTFIQDFRAANAGAE